MEKLSRQQILTLPNGLTIIRVLAIPFIIIMLFSPVRISQIITAFLFLFVAVTDTLDGYLARRRNLVTTLGKFLDPLADKLLIVAALIALISARGIPTWMVIVVVGREIAVTGLRGIAAAQGMVISANAPGKYKTFFEVASIFFLILDGNYGSLDFDQIGLGLLWIAVFLAVFSGVGYFRQFLKEMVE